MRAFRKMAQKVINLGLIVTSALMMWKGLMVMSNAESPVVVVLSGSMEPAFWRGDILFLWLGSAPFQVPGTTSGMIQSIFFFFFARLPCCVYEVFAKQKKNALYFTSGANVNKDCCYLVLFISSSGSSAARPSMHDSDYVWISLSLSLTRTRAQTHTRTHT